MSVRKAHNSGRNHLRNVVDYYQQIGHEKAQSVIDSITSSYAAEGQAHANPMLPQNQPGSAAAAALAGGPPPGLPPHLHHPGAPGAGTPPGAGAGAFPPPPFNFPAGMPPPPFPGMPGVPPPPGGFPQGLSRKFSPVPRFTCPRTHAMHRLHTIRSANANLTKIHTNVDASTTVPPGQAGSRGGIPPPFPGAPSGLPPPGAPGGLPFPPPAGMPFPPPGAPPFPFPGMPGAPPGGFPTGPSPPGAGGFPPPPGR